MDLPSQSIKIDHKILIFFEEIEKPLGKVIKVQCINHQ